ncbi:MAG: bifunctional diaminohydroxyphosphoribosylaminopyrimidine deaminase/5-amino-6-(5-phosphoribosylamino)uracil reductase RibD [Planctomycetota bacterium]|nr:bifunctional diaminohydroxyphosphoribosylaminopyrimidine deaminase/5-amino-6-(5-phosphoribosylamino)uracil reductase RibD [Planctomycetota bacterium]
MLRRAALLALRAMGRVEPNPMVGCIITDEAGDVMGMGHHRVFGGPHAEVEALADCARRGRDPRGATVYVTLEPCKHQGKTPPCTDALIRAKVARVVVGRRDPNRLAAGGAQVLTRAGIRVDFADGGPLVARPAAPFERSVNGGPPWIIAKWAQTIDGKVAARTGDSKWISCEASRRLVHRLRGRVDAIVTGVGTVRADDPMLTARGVPVRRVARRVVIDSAATLPLTSALVRTARETPLVVCTAELSGAAADRASELQRAGALVIQTPGGPRVNVRAALTVLSQHFGVTTALVEAGPVLLGSLLSEQLVDEALVFVAPRVLGDDQAPGAAMIGPTYSVRGGAGLVLRHVTRRGPDALLLYARGGAPENGTVS